MELPDVSPGTALHNVRQVRQARVQKLHHGRVRAFLGREHMRRAQRAAQWVVDIAHGHQLRARKYGMQAGKVDLRNLRQRCPHRHKGLACRVAEHCTQRCRSAAASVVCGAASQPHHQPFAAALQRMGHQFTHAVGSSLFGVQALAHQRQARRRRHLDDGHTVRQHAVERGHFLEVRAFYSHGDLFPAHSLQKRIHTSFASVRHRHAVHLGVRIIFLHRLRHYGTDLGRGHGSLEGIGDEDHFFHDLRSLSKKSGFQLYRSRGPAPARARSGKTFGAALF